MAKSHKDLPGGSQAWAAEVDALLEENKKLREVVRQLCANAGIDFANPKRGINAGDTPSVKNPVAQKLSSLADTDTYNVADKQVLTWNQQGQKWLPATLPSAGGTIDISEISYSTLGQGYGVITDPANYAYIGAGVVDGAFEDFHYIENWTTGSAYYGSGDWNNGTGYSLIEMSPGDGFGRPFVTISADDYVDGTYNYVTVSSYQLRINGGTLEPTQCYTADRPEIVPGTREGAIVFDIDLGIPIQWNGTQWTNLIGTAV